MHGTLSAGFGFLMQNKSYSFCVCWNPTWTHYSWNIWHRFIFQKKNSFLCAKRHQVAHIRWSIGFNQRCLWFHSFASLIVVAESSSHIINGPTFHSLFLLCNYNSDILLIGCMQTISFECWRRENWQKLTRKHLTKNIITIMNRLHKTQRERQLKNIHEWKKKLNKLLNRQAVERQKNPKHQRRPSDRKAFVCDLCVISICWH